MTSRPPEDAGRGGGLRIKKGTMDNDRITGFRAVHPGEVLGEELKERGIKL